MEKGFPRHSPGTLAPGAPWVTPQCHAWHLKAHAPSHTPRHRGSHTGTERAPCVPQHAGLSIRRCMQWTAPGDQEQQGMTSRSGNTGDENLPYADSCFWAEALTG